MARYRCPRCHEVTYRPELFASCGICSAPLSAGNLELEAGQDPYDRSLPEEAAAAHEHAMRGISP